MTSPSRAASPQSSLRDDSSPIEGERENLYWPSFLIELFSEEIIEDRVGSYTKAVIINSPNNPTGAMYSEEFISDVVQFCEKKDFWLIMDDIYHRLIFDGRKVINPFKYAKKQDENSKLIIVNGVSKQYAMTGFRIGWAVGNKKVIAAMSNIQGHRHPVLQFFYKKLRLVHLMEFNQVLNP